MRRKLLTLLLTAALALSLLPAAALAAEETDPAQPANTEETTPEPEVSFEFVEGNDVYLGPFTEGDAPLSGLSGSLHVKNTGERAIRLNYSWPRCNLTEKFLQVNVTHGITIQPGESAAIPTGIYAEIPQGYELQVRPRSGLALRHAVTVLNTPGTIDADYRGEIRVILINHGRSPFTVHKGDRIAQVVLAPALRADFTAADSLSQTERGAGGFGSTGV